MFRTILTILFLLVSATASGSTVLLLKDGGTLEGELLNPDEISRKSYRIKTAGKLEISLDARLVERVQNRERPALVEYYAKAPFTENTIDNHLFWARWCSENQFPDLSRLHWRQILEIDPDHAVARQILGYTRDQNGWVSDQEKRENRGLVQYRGRWRTPHEIEVETMLESRRNAEIQWRNTIRDLTRRLPNNQAETQLLAIRDPAAFVPIRDALLNALSNERNPNIRRVLLRSLVRIPHAGAVQFVVGWSIRDEEPYDDIRLMCVEEVLRLSHDNPELRQIMMETYRSALRTGIEPIVNMAARILKDIGGYEAVPELIDALVIMRTETFQEQQPAYSFGPGGTGLSQGARTIKNQRRIPNQAVLAALTELTGRNFLFDQAAWQEWYRQSQRSPSVNLRRN